MIMTGQAIICKLPELQDIEGADRIKQATIFGETIIVSKDHKKGELGLLFDCETQLSHEFAHHNNLYRHAELNFDKTKSGYFDDNRRVRPIRLKSVKVSAFWMPIESIEYTGFSDLMYDYSLIGTQISGVEKYKICEKFITKQTKQAMKRKEGRVSKKDLVPTFKEHFDTDHWERGKHTIQQGDLITITEKLHGTSFRCGNMITLEKKTIWYRLMFTLFRLLAGFGWEWTRSKFLEEYKFVVGSRRTIKSIEGEEVNTNSFYDTDLWTRTCEPIFKGKLEKGETVYGEIVGYQPERDNATGKVRPIMGTHSNSKLKNFMSKEEYKEFIDKYGEETVFSYGCATQTNKVFVYRITRTLPDGTSIDLTWDQVKMRCEQIGVEHVPELSVDRVDFMYKTNERNTPSDKYINDLLEMESVRFPTHLKEGICIRVDNGSFTPKILKHKAYNFKVLEGIIKDTDQVDIEESN
jgi:hypothetical protein